MPEEIKTKAPDEEKEKGTPLEFLKKHVYDITSYLGLAVVVALFVIFNMGPRFMYNLSSVLQSAATYAVIALGAVFVYSMGFMDVSIGQQVGVYAILMILIGNSIGGVPGIIAGFLTVLVLALVCGAINGAVAVWLGLPSIVTSLFLMFFFTGAQYLLMESTGENTLYLAQAIRPENRDAYSIMLVAIIVVLALVAAYFFKYTKLGKYTRAIGANETAAAQCGINTIKWRVMGYVALGACVALGAFVYLTRSGSASKGSGTGYAMDIMICLILGGMPLKGGMGSKISSALVGSFTYTLLSSDLTSMGVGLNMINFVKALIFLAIVLCTCRKKDGVLPR